MGILEDVVVNAKSAVNAVGKKAGIMVDISKLRISAADLNREIAERYESLGRVIYDSQKTGTPSDELVEECVAAIDELYDQLDLINAQLLEFRNKTVCKNCGKENPQEAFFCSYCGTRLREEKAEEPVEKCEAEKCEREDPCEEDEQEACTESVGEPDSCGNDVAEESASPEDEPKIEE